MATIQQIRGMLFEEAVLFLLTRAGYTTVDEPDGDTLKRVGAGLAVIGRGGVHQIDAIADYVITPAFAHPQRLLVEAKCYGSAVGLPVIRNAVGVLKDVNEYWNPRRREVDRSRFHYLQAVFSSSDFTSDAEDYAFAPLLSGSLNRPAL
ncbi:MAG TPA: restriction endonuclease [Longimicrobium sp.]|nr:restriction endonuclease [Longimicrobium sp.]